MRKLALIGVVLLFVTSFAYAQTMSGNSFPTTSGSDNLMPSSSTAIPNASKTTSTTSYTLPDGTKVTTITTKSITTTVIQGVTKILSENTVINTKSSDGSASTASYNINYSYDSAGKLIAVKGQGTETAKDGQTGFVSSSSIVGTYSIQNGQAMLTSSKTTGTVKDTSGKQINNFAQTVTYSYQTINNRQYLAKQTSTNLIKAADGSAESITKTKVYQRDASGNIIGVSQIATGNRTVVVGMSGTTPILANYAISNYKATFAKDSSGRFYLASEDYSWVLTSSGNKTTTTTSTSTYTLPDGRKVTTQTTKSVTTTVILGATKVLSEKTVTNTSGSDGSNSTSTNVVNYKYDAVGNLLSASSQGTQASKDAQTGHVSTSTTTGTYVIQNGKALLTSSTTAGTIKDKDGRQIGTISEKKTYSYQTINNTQFVAREITSTTRKGIDGSSETITTTKTYQRDASGNVIGVSQIATGTKSVITGVSGTTTAQQNYVLGNYKATFSKDSSGQFYLASESYDWSLASTVTSSTTKQTYPDGSSVTTSKTITMKMIAGVSRVASEKTVTTTATSRGETSTSTSVVNYAYNAAGKLLSENAVTDIKSSDGSTSQSVYTVNYSYDAAGNLVSASGQGAVNSKDGETGQVSTSITTGTYVIQNGKALLSSFQTAGTIKDKSGLQIGTSQETRAYTYQVYNNVPLQMKEITTTAWKGADGSSESITKTMVYQRDASGKIIGVSQVATGNRIVITGANGTIISTQRYVLSNYKATFAKDPSGQFYLASEDYTWVLI